jgi:hypothetical protein
MNVEDVELGQLLLGADPDQLGLVSIHLQLDSAHPLDDALHTNRETVSNRCSISCKGTDKHWVLSIYECAARPFCVVTLNSSGV